MALFMKIIPTEHIIKSNIKYEILNLIEIQFLQSAGV